MKLNKIFLIILLVSLIFNINYSNSQNDLGTVGDCFNQNYTHLIYINYPQNEDRLFDIYDIFPMQFDYNDTTYFLQTEGEYLEWLGYSDSPFYRLIEKSGIKGYGVNIYKRDLMATILIYNGDLVVGRFIIYGFEARDYLFIAETKTFMDGERYAYHIKGHNGKACMWLINEKEFFINVRHS